MPVTIEVDKDEWYPVYTVSLRKSQSRSRRVLIVSDTEWEEIKSAFDAFEKVQEKLGKLLPKGCNMAPTQNEDAARVVDPNTKVTGSSKSDPEGDCLNRCRARGLTPKREQEKGTK